MSIISNISRHYDTSLPHDNFSLLIYCILNKCRETNICQFERNKAEFRMQKSQKNYLCSHNLTKHLQWN
jgi:hypothetical protein